MAHAADHQLGFRPHAHEELLLVCVQAVRDSGQQQRLHQLVTSPNLDWTEFWKLVQEHEVEPLVAQALSTQDMEAALPAEIVAKARTLRFRTLATNLAIAAELEHLALELHARAIPVVPLKGVHLANRLYGSLDARRVGDIDILVPEKLLEAARVGMRALGYELHEGTSHGVPEHNFHGVPFVREAGGVNFVVELHWGLTDHRFATVAYDELWRRVLTASDPTHPLRPLPSEETLLYLALHLPKHPTGVLRLLADIDRLVRLESESMDWNYTIELARRWSVSTLLYFALRRCRALFDTPVPPAVLDACRPARWRRALVGVLTAPRAVLRPSYQGATRYSRSQLAYCAMIDPLERSLRAYREYLFLPAEREHALTRHPVIGAVDRSTRGLARTALALGSVMTTKWTGGVALPHRSTSDRAR